MKSKGLTRRQLAAAAAALPAASQNPPTPAKQANELEAARTQVRQASGALRKAAIDTLLEPSFVFKA